jgi:hypothetical protein
MNEIELDPRKLLGFKIIATGESNATLRSPKIGGKACEVTDAALAMNNVVLCANVGEKLPE